MKPPRGLTAEEAALWQRVARTVTPLPGRKIPPRNAEGGQPKSIAAGANIAARARQSVSTSPPPPLSPRAASPAPQSGEDRRAQPLDRHGLDASWDRKLARGVVQPDFTLDLHGASLDAAYTRLHHGLTQALAQGARVVLLITGRARSPGDHASRGERRGAIRAKFLDWLEAGPHASRIAAVRPAHPRHGGAGAVYIVLRKMR